MAGDADAPDEGNVTERARRWSRAVEDVRSRSEISAKAIGALGTAALSAVGIAKLGDVFPLPPGDLSAWMILAVIAVPLSFAGMAFAIVAYSIRLWRANEPVTMQSDPAAIDGLDCEEIQRVQNVYETAALAHGATSLQAYEQEAATLERDAAAPGLKTTKVAALRARAHTIRAEVDEAQQRALLNVARVRARESVKGSRSIAIYVLFGLSFLVFAIGTDYLDSERSARVDAAKACAEAVSAVRTDSPTTAPLLPPICGGKAAADPLPVPRTVPRSSTQSELAGATTDLEARLKACRSVASGRAAQARCAQIRTVLIRLKAGGP